MEFPNLSSLPRFISTVLRLTHLYKTLFSEAPSIILYTVTHTEETAASFFLSNNIFLRILGKHSIHQHPYIQPAWGHLKCALPPHSRNTTKKKRRKEEENEENGDI